MGRTWSFFPGSANGVADADAELSAAAVAVSVEVSVVDEAADAMPAAASPGDVVFGVLVGAGAKPDGTAEVGIGIDVTPCEYILSNCYQNEMLKTEYSRLRI